MKELTPQQTLNLGPILYVGTPGPRLLWEWIQPVAEPDLDMLIPHDTDDELIYRTPDWTSPLDVRNWVASETDYVSDLRQYGVIEHWPDPGFILENEKDDCDGLAILTASILFSFNVPNIRLTLGTYGDIGHMWVQWHPQEAMIIETTGTRPVDRLPLVRECPEYKARMQAQRTGSETGRIWVANEVYNDWGDIGLI
jgi:hypothetical protein